jgi:pseudolysin/vibriolysin
VIQSNRRTLHLLTLTPLALALASGAAFAASKSDLHANNVSLLNAQYKAAVAKSGAPLAARERHAEMIGLEDESSLKLLDSNEDADGTTNYRYQQTFRGVPVWGEHVVVSEDAAGNLKHLFGRKVDGLAGELAAGDKGSVDRGRALGLAKGHARKTNNATIRNEKAEQVVYVGDDKHARLAWVVEFVDDGGAAGAPSRPFAIIDAHNGKVLESWDGLTTSLVGTGPGGNGKTGQYEWGSGGKFGYMDVTQSGTTCTMNNAKVKAVNLNGGTTSTTAYSYTCPRNTFKTINGGYSPINDALQFGGVITNMYPAYTGYNALSFQLVMRVHYSSAYENAFWDGSTMSFGDGASTFYPLVNADVSGHEVSHGFTEQHSNLTYSGQSGGMNEAFSDMGGEATEFYWQGSNDFLVGKEIFKASGALRYMSNPPQDGGSIDNAANYTSSMDVHYSSGVYNKAFWKLATTAGWDVPKAFKVMARANALYWTPSSTFNTGACGVETAATDLGYTKADVTAAFTLVGVSCAGGGGGGGGGPLTNGVAKTGQSGAAGSSTSYTLVVPAGATGLKFVTSGGTGDADLYVKFGSAPTTTVNDCKSEGGTTAETCNIATAQAGTYYVLVKGYTAYSGMSITGSYTTGGGGGCGGTVLCSGTAVALPAVATGGVSSNYTLVVPSGKTSAVFTISGGTGDADMYVRVGAAPTTTTYNCRPYLSGNAETCTFNAPAAGTYYVNVRAYSGFSGVSLKGTVQ